AQGLRRPGPVDVERRPGERTPAARFIGAEHEDPVRLGRAAGLVAPQLRHLADGRDVVEGYTREPIAFGLGGLFPGTLSEADAAVDPSAAVGLDVADDEHDDGIVGEDGSESGEHVAQERKVWLAVVGI